MLESVRLLLDAGADVQGVGDVHKGDVIGWAACEGNDDVINLLLARGARHHIFSAMALRDRDLVRSLVEQDPDCLLRRRSRFENEHTPVHAAFAAADGIGYLAGRPDHAMLELLIKLGADIDDRRQGRTPLAVALMRGDHEAIRLLRAAGAKEPPTSQPSLEAATNLRDAMTKAASSVKKLAPMISVRDMPATVRWYRAIGFEVHDEYEDGGELVFARFDVRKR